MIPVQLNVDDLAVQKGLADKIARLQRPRPLMLSIAEYLAESTRMRFTTARAPDGTPWAPNTQTTMERYIAQRGGYSKKTGKISKRGADLATAKKPLTGATRLLGTQVVYEADDAMLQVGSNRIYARVMQEGADAGSLGGGAPWGDIPERVYLGLSASDRSYIVQEVTGYIDN